MSFFGRSLPNIGELKAKRNVNSLNSALGYKKGDTSQENARVRREAAEALGEIKDTRSVKPLIAALTDKDEDMGVRRAAATALGKIGDARAIPALLDSLNDISLSGQAAGALAELGTQSVEPLVVQFRNLDTRLFEGTARSSLQAPEISRAQKSICGVLVMIGEPSVDSLIAIYRDTGRPEWGFGGASARAHSIEALGEICTRVRDPDLHARVVQEIISGTRWGSWDESNSSVAVVLGEIGVHLEDPAMSAQVMRRLIDLCASHGPGQYEARGALVKLGPKAVEPLIAALQSDESYGRGTSGLQNIAATLALIGDKRALGPIVELLSRPGTSYHVADSLKRLGWQPDESRAGAAYWALAQQWDKCVEIGRPAVEPLIEALKDHKFGLSGQNRAAIIQALGQIGDERAVEPLFTLFIMEISFTSDRALMEQVAQALEKIGQPALAVLDACVQREHAKLREWNYRNTSAAAIVKIAKRLRGDAEGERWAESAGVPWR
jgi:HEAT repeat protein